jgi:tetratricopeptide (TPR) repeat protein
MQFQGKKRTVTVMLWGILFLLPVMLLAQKQGQAAIDSMLKDLAKTRADTNRVKLQQEITMTYAGLDLGKSMIYARQSLELAEQIKWEPGMAVSARYIGNILMEQGEYAAAIAQFEKSLRLCTDLGDQRGMVSNLYNMGAANQRQSNSADAARYFVKGLKIAEDLKSNYLVAQGTGNLATVFLQQRNYRKGREYGRKALAAATKDNDRSAQAKAWEDIGYSFMLEKKLDTARRYYANALALYRQLQDQMGEATIYSQFVETYAGAYPEQLVYLLKAQHIWNRIAPENLMAISNTGNIGMTYLGIINSGLLQLKEGNAFVRVSKQVLITKAEAYLKNAIALSKKTHSVDVLIQFSKAYAELLNLKGDYKAAYLNLANYVSLQDSLYSQDTKNKIAAIEGQREIALRDKQIALRKLEVRQLWSYGILAIVLVCAVLFYFLNRYRLRQLKLKNLMQQQQAEQRAKELIHQNKLSESELKAIRAQMNPHFIFNVLNSIESYIIENDSKRASRLVQKFAGLSRLILENSTQSLVSADREWKALRLYTELEAMRFNNQFAYKFTVDPQIDLSKFLVPPMLVQPLIENAIHHGLRNYPHNDGLVAVTLTKENDQLLFIVTDNGIGLNAAAKRRDNINPIKQQSMALTGIKERIAAINMAAGQTVAAFEIREITAEGKSGTIASLKLPI